MHQPPITTWDLLLSLTYEVTLPDSGSAKMSTIHVKPQCIAPHLGLPVIGKTQLAQGIMIYRMSASQNTQNKVTPKTPIRFKIYINPKF